MSLRGWPRGSQPREFLVYSFCLKLAYTRHIPFLLVGFGHRCVDKARQAAKICIEQYALVLADGAVATAHHRLSRRLLEPGNALRQSVERFSQGLMHKERGLESCVFTLLGVPLSVCPRSVVFDSAPHNPNKPRGSAGSGKSCSRQPSFCVSKGGKPCRRARFAS